MSESNAKSGGIGFVGLLTIVFITLKLLGEIRWSWWWVLSPLWIIAIVLVLVLLVALVLYFISERNETRTNPKESN